jgi:hypothetical protein
MMEREGRTDQLFRRMEWSFRSGCLAAVTMPLATTETHMFLNVFGCLGSLLMGCAYLEAIDRRIDRERRPV